MEQSEAKKLIRQIVKIITKNDKARFIYPEKIAAPLRMLPEDVKNILLDLADEFRLENTYNLHCIKCGKYLSQYNPWQLESKEFLVCDKCKSLNYPCEAVEVFYVCGEPEWDEVVEKIIMFIDEGSTKIYPMEIAKLLNKSYKSVVKVLDDLSYMNPENELICPYCGMIQGAFSPGEVSQVSGCTAFPCKSCHKDLGPIHDEDLYMVYRADGCTKRGEGYKAITPEMVYNRYELEQRR